MVHECEHFYETGRKCRRITKRGEALCPGHRPGGRNPPRSVHDDPAFHRQIAGWIAQLRAADDLSFLCSLQDALRAIQLTIERKSSRARYAQFVHATAVVSIAIERVHCTLRLRTPADSHAGQQQRSESI